MKMTEITDQIYAVCSERIPDNGEDSLFGAVRENIAMAAVFDGCGGSGSQRYQGGKIFKGAYAASRATSGAVRDWFYEHCGEKWDSDEEMAKSIRSYIDRGMKFCKENAAAVPSRIRTKLLFDFPTTAAMAVAVPEADLIRLRIIWVGDSRVYLLNQDGLAQLSQDDSGQKDSRRSNDGAAMENVINAGGCYEMNTASMLLSPGKPCLVFTATDGCFGYYPTPVQFEQMLLEKIDASDSPQEFENRLKEVFADMPDDCTMVILSLGFGTFSRTKQSLRTRKKRLYENYIIRIPENADEQERQKLYRKMEEQYWPGYSRYIKKKT